QTGYIPLRCLLGSYEPKAQNRIFPQYDRGIRSFREISNRYPHAAAEMGSYLGKTPYAPNAASLMNLYQSNTS
ncbi:hypothetical protein D030_2566B, partial [Vibrio parahaemolyticus AQ3810]